MESSLPPICGLPSPCAWFYASVTPLEFATLAVVCWRFLTIGRVLYVPHPLPLRFPCPEDRYWIDDLLNAILMGKRPVLSGTEPSSEADACTLATGDVLWTMCS